MTNNQTEQTLADRATQLESANAQLRAELAALKPPAKSQLSDLASARAFEEPSASVTDLPIFKPSLEMPNGKQLGELHVVVQTWAPKFGLANVAPDEFRRGFIFAGNCVRLDALAEDRNPGWWSDAGEAWLTRHSLPGGLSAAAFTAGVLAHGDILFSDLHRWPFDSKVGLALPGYQGRPATNKWRNLLNGSGRLLEPFKKYPFESTVIRPEHGHIAALTR